MNDWSVGPNRGAFKVEPTTGIPTFRGSTRADLYYLGEAGGGSFKDFEFKAMVKTVAEANSGAFLHI